MQEATNQQPVEAVQDVQLDPLAFYVRPQNHVQMDIIETSNGYAIVVNQVPFAIAGEVLGLKSIVNKIIDDMTKPNVGI